MSESPSPLRPRGTVDVVASAALAAATAGVAILVASDGSPGWRLARALAVVAIAALVHLAARGRLAVLTPVSGMVAAAVGVGFIPHRLGTPTTALGIVALMTVGSGLVVIGASTAALLRSRRWPGRAAGSVAAIAGTLVVASVVAPAVVATNVADLPIGATPSSRGLAYEDVWLTDADGFTLAAWYIRSENGAALVLRHGAGSTRSDVLDHAEVLASHGYGVLLTDARGHGQSQGRAMDFGWNGDTDIAAATAFLAGRPEVDPHRIGVVGMSMGGEEAIGAAGSDPLLRAVVAEGATARTAADKGWLSERYGWRGRVQLQVERLQYRLTDLLTDAPRPTALRDAVRRSEARFLLVTAESMPDEGHAARDLASIAPARVEVWSVPGASHTGGLATDPTGWERRVVAFLDDQLLASP